MANTNFKTWLDSAALSGDNAQQSIYNGITSGFSAGGQIKAGDFNAALRMTTLVCAGIAAACEFDNLKIDAAEDAIKNAITAKLITPCSNLLTALENGTNNYRVAYAAESGKAASADYATDAGTAKSAEKDKAGNTITTTYGKFSDGFAEVPKIGNPYKYKLPGNGTYHIRIEDHYDSTNSTKLRRVDFGIVYCAKNETVQSPCFNTNDNSIYSFQISPDETDGTAGIIEIYRGQTKLQRKINEQQPTYVVIYYKKIL